jgi:hypothetical protein
LQTVVAIEKRLQLLGRLPKVRIKAWLTKLKQSVSCSTRHTQLSQQRQQQWQAVHLPLVARCCLLKLVYKYSRTNASTISAWDNAKQTPP